MPLLCLHSSQKERPAPSEMVKEGTSRPGKKGKNIIQMKEVGGGGGRYCNQSPPCLHSDSSTVRPLLYHEKKVNEGEAGTGERNAKPTLACIETAMVRRGCRAQTETRDRRKKSYNTDNNDWGKENITSPFINS